jgi:hypothetical protein
MSMQPVFSLNTDRPNEDECVLWSALAQRMLGFSLTRLTFQRTHARDSDTNAERDYVINELRQSDVHVCSCIA